jgi:hypothetical protein
MGRAEITAILVILAAVLVASALWGWSPLDIFQAGS